MQIYDELAYHEYGLPATQEECDSLGVSCQKGSCVVLLNHGLLTFASTAHGALKSLYMLERACELELISRTLGEPPVMIDEAVVSKMGSVMKKVRADHQYGLHDWNALIRLVDSKGGIDFRN
jgi:ribulose-5-phosphate 4-epimerase/fuculose-1-phosphate aldolase